MGNIDLDALEKLNRERTQGEWEADGDETEDGHGKYYAYVILSDAGNLADSSNSPAATILDDRDGEGGSRWDDTGRRNFHFIAHAANNFAELIRLARIGQAVEQDINTITRSAMADAWNEICADSDHHPRDLTHGRGSYLEFEPSTWADWTAMNIAVALKANGPTKDVQS